MRRTMIRRSSLILSFLIAVFALRLPAQSVPTASELVAKYISAAGGAEKIKAITSLRMTGKFTGGGGFEAGVRQFSQRPGKVREEFILQGLIGVNAYDGNSGWKIEPWEGNKSVQPLGEEDLKSIVEDSDFDGPLLNDQQKGNKIEYAGTELVEGTGAYKLKVTSPNGDIRYFFLDTDSYIPIRVEIQRTVRGAERIYEQTLGNYKKVNGWYLPFSVETNVKGSANRQKVTYSTIEANVPMSEALFIAPAAGAKESAQTKLPDASAMQQKPEDVMSGGVRPAGSSPINSSANSATASATQAGHSGTMTASPRSSRPVSVDSETISGLGARNIGSAAMSGRIAAIDAVHEGGRLTLYVGAGSGGIWKSVNGGTTYKPVFDKQPVQSIGAITIDPKNPKTIWVGTGESWTRNSVSIGNGVYKSTDGGQNWTNVGLAESERIVKIAVDPTDSNNVYVCVPGKLWSDSEERGVYRTTDGGTSWTRILKGSNSSTGCSMLALDSSNPRTLYAGMWDFRRKGWTFRSGGDGPDTASGSGLFKSVDGGSTWNSLDERSAAGLPSKPWGRVAVTVAPSNSNVIYTMIEAAPPKNGLYRSDDGGRTWTARDRSQYMVWRPFYFANLIVDPKDENRIYKPDLVLIGSNDGGRSFSEIGGGAHGDFHTVWIDPNDTERLIAGDDGGVWYSYDSGNRWWKAENLPVSQFYHVSVDMDRPYHVYGGLQDNSSWVGDSQYPGGITNSRWENMYGGDGFWMFVDPSDPDYIYAESQGGEIGRINRHTHESRTIKPLPDYKEGKLRFNWNTPLHVSADGTVYLGAQFLFRSKDHGQTWQRISPDLTTNDPAKQQQERSGGVTVDNSSAEMHTTIYAISASPKNTNVIWVGTDDGNVQVTSDGGRTWSNVTSNIAGLPKNAWVSYIDAGHFDEGTAYATFDNHTFGDMRPFAYRTRDFGRTWTPLITADATVRGYAHVVREDLVRGDLLFLGTEMGLWVSLDGGSHWAQYKGGDLPDVSVRDLVIHPRDHDLVIATHGRGIWIVDDITPLRSLTPATLGTDAAFVAARPAVQQIPAFGGWAGGDATFTGPNPPGDAVITYYQRARHIFGDLDISVTDASGKTVGTIPSSKRRGLNRVSWSMRMPPPVVPTAATRAGGAGTGPRLPPGTYTVKMTKDGQTYSAPLTVLADPRSKATVEDRKAQYDLAMDLYNQLGRMSYAVDRINGLRLALEERAGSLSSGDPLAARLRTAAAQTDELRKRIVATKEGGAITGEERLREFLADLYGGVVGYEGRPTAAQVARTEAISRELGDVTKDFENWLVRELPSINTDLAGKKLPPIEPLTRERWQISTGNR